MTIAQIINVVVIAHVLLCPHVKVEESFNTQALHDIMIYKNNLSRFDHLEFPGVVPRSFIPALFFNAVFYPIYLVLDVRKYYLQILIRIVIGTVMARSVEIFSIAVSKSSLREIAVRFIVITASQFHIPFYLSRPLPNIFAFGLMMHAMAALLQGRDRNFIAISGFVILVLRCELALLCGPLLLFGLLSRLVKPRLSHILLLPVVAIYSIGVSVAVDSYFWRRTIWPEGMVFLFNVVENKSHQWGVLPFHWYFTHAIPKAMLLTSALFVGWLMLNLLWTYRYLAEHFLPHTSVEGTDRLRNDRRLSSKNYPTVGLVLCALLFVFFYSFLPHKEFRFIIYAIPVFNLGAAYFWYYCESVWEYVPRHRRFFTFSKFLRSLIVVGCYAHVALNVALTALFLLAAHYNYPGGESVRLLNTLPSLVKADNVHVHICNLAAQSGVTRFLEERPTWIYNKTEHIEHTYNTAAAAHFTHLIVEATARSDRLPDEAIFQKLFEVVAFKGIKVTPATLPWNALHYEYQPAVAVYQRRSWLPSSPPPPHRHF